MDTDALAYVDGLTTCFADLHDPRVKGRCDHALLDLLAITLLAVLSSCDDWPDIERFARTREDWLKTFLPLPNGIPSHDTLLRVFGLLDRQQFAAGLFQWTRALHEATGGKVVAIDGKTARRPSRRNRALAPAPGHGVGDERRPDARRGRLRGEVQRDHGHPGTAEGAQHHGLHRHDGRDGLPEGHCRANPRSGGSYVLGLKGNQSCLERVMLQLLAGDLEAEWESEVPVPKERIQETNGTGHGRVERLTCRAVEIPADHPPAVHLEGVAYAGGVDVLPDCRGPRDVGDAVVRQQSQAEGESAGGCHSPALGRQEYAALELGRYLR